MKKKNKWKDYCMDLTKEGKWNDRKMNEWFKGSWPVNIFSGSEFSIPLQLEATIQGRA